MEPKYKIIVIGQLTLDDVVKFDQPALLDSPGGSGLYALAGVCLWDIGPLGFVTRRGNDYDLSPISNEVGERLDTKGIKMFDAPSIHIWNMFDRKGNRYFINQRWGSFDDIMGILPEDIPAEYNSTQSFLVAAYPVDWQSKVIRALPEGATILVDPHFQGVYPQYHDLWNELLKKISIFLPSEEEFIRFYSIKCQESLSAYIPYMKDLSSRGPQIVGVKLGERGAIVYDRNMDSTWHVPAYPTKNLVDVTGCGDAFCGGFIASYVRNKDAYTSALYGTISSSFNLEDYGVLHNFSINHQRVIERYNEFNVSLNRNEQKID
jgi:sugar/nucleoside kinase (ribokinase family)